MLDLRRRPRERGSGGPLLVAIDDPAAAQIVWRELDRHLVARQNLDEVHPHLARDVGQHLVSVLELDAEHRVGQRLDDRSLDLDAFFFRQTDLAPHHNPEPERISGPSDPTATVCSKCALSEPSFVTTVQPTDRVRTSRRPACTIGSIASTCPAISRGPRSGGPKFGTCGSSCIWRPMPWPSSSRTTEYPCRSACD